ncbi:MAG: 2-oxoacid:acceptor oxidoreductase family protein [Deltaproteobacteria bacterium]|nr:2-oxoacid:acceptor oxidoreductase family protein [Deltaproteobacteria bacterium]
MKSLKYPGIPSTADGSESVVWVETHITEGACAYPITPSTNMGQGYQGAVSNGKKNLWGVPLSFLELESEHSSASSCEGFALAGGRVSNFTSGQGLILMKEVLYTISGKRLPVVFHIGARALTSQSLNIHAGHDDVIGVSDVGWGMLFAKNAQEAADFALISRRAAEGSQTPFMNIQDGFLTTHTIENVLFPEPELMKEFVGDPQTKLFNLMDPENPLMTGSVQNQDSYMKGKIAQRFFYDTVQPHLETAMKEFGKLTGRDYGLIESYHLEDAVNMKVGALIVKSYRPFPSKEIVQALKHVKAFAVIERLDIPLMASNPLTTEIQAAFVMESPRLHPKIFSGAYGLGGRNFSPNDVISVFEMLKKGMTHSFFTLGIPHPTSLPAAPETDIRSKNTFSLRGHSIGGYGSITTNKILATLLSDVFGLYVQAFPKYGSEKKGLPTNYYLTISPEKVRTYCEVEHVDFVALNNTNAFNLGNPLQGLSHGGILFIQSPHRESSDIWKEIPPQAQKTIQEQNIRVFFFFTVAIAKIQRMQGIALLGIFLKLTPFMKREKMSEPKLFEGVGRALKKYFGSRGETVLQDNLYCIKRGYNEVFEVQYEKI